MTDITLDQWTRQIADALGVPADAVDRDAILDLARVAAHGIARPAAPLTTFIAGYAAGVNGGGRDAVAAAFATVTAEIDHVTGDPT